MASVTTRDHEEIRNWADDHDATPAVVSRTGGMLRFEFGAPAELAEVSWDDFFNVFDERGLELVYDDKPGSRFHKLVYPETAEGAKPARRTARAQITPIQTARGRSRAASGRTAAAKARGSRPTASRSRSKTTGTAAKTTKSKRSSSRAPRKAA
jgi:hypothetical protein